MSLWKKFFGSKGSSSESPSRAAAESRTTQPSICCPSHPAHALALEADNLEGQERVQMIDRALALSPQDVDLLYAKACALDEVSGDHKQVAQFGKLHPSHFDTAMKGKNFGFNRPLPDNWECLFDLGSWSATDTELKGLMSSRLSQEKNTQLVRFCLVPTVAMVYGCEKSVSDQINRMRWELRWAKTPKGTIAVHYLIMDCGKNGTLRNEAFLPHGVSNPPSARDGYYLLQRLGQSDHCFLVLADGSGQVSRNEFFEFPDAVKRTLREVKKELDSAGPARNPAELMRTAGKWYMDNTDLKSIKF